MTTREKRDLEIGTEPFSGSIDDGDLRSEEIWNIFAQSVYKEKNDRTECEFLLSSGAAAEISTVVVVVQ